MTNRNKVFSLMFLIFISIIPALSLFHPGLPITHDGQDHVARIANFYQNLSEGNIIPRWAPNLNWGYGHPILEFLYPLPSYIASIFHFAGFSLVDSVKIVFGLAFILSGVFMYLWLREFLGEIGAFTGGILYMFAPYRFVDLYVRGALGEHVAFVFLPLILFFILKSSKEKYSSLLIVGGSLSVTGLVLSHNAISLMFMPIIFLYTLFIFCTTNNKKLQIYQYTSILVLGLGLSAFFWIPAFFEGKYTLRDIVTSSDYSERFLQFKDFIYGEWNYGITGQFTTQIGISHWILTILSLPVALSLHKKKNKFWILTLGSFIIFVLTLFLMHSSSKFIWENISTLQKFQFPWRFLSVTVFVSSLLGGIVLSSLNKFRFMVFSLLIIAIFLLNKDYWKAQGYLYKPESFYKGIYNSTTDTGESSPVWSVRFMEKAPKAHLELLDGDAKITETKRMSTHHAYNVEVKQKTLFAENTLYFPGWEIRANSNPVKIEYQNQQYRGIMLFFLDKGNYKIESLYRETKLRAFADAISVVVFFNILGFVFFRLARYLFVKNKDLQNEERDTHSNDSNH